MAEGKQNLQNAAIIAKLFGVTDRRIQQLAKDGISSRPEAAVYVRPASDGAILHPLPE